MLIAGLGLVVLVAVMLIVSSPVHRAFYLGIPEDRDAARRFEMPPLPALARQVKMAAAIVVPVSVKRRVLEPGSDGNIVVPVTDEMPPRLPATGVPSGWDVKEFTGRADVELVKGDHGPAIRLRSVATSFALFRDVVVDVEQTPILSWSWKAVKLPARGDVRHSTTDDQAVQLYVVFPRWPAPRTTSEVIGYVWDTTAAAGTTVTSSKASNVKIVVVESGPARVGSWLRYQRNLYDDYVALFNTKPPRAGMIAVMTDANDTGSTAEALMGPVMFAPRTADARKATTFMLR